MRVLSRRGWFGKVLGVIGGVVGAVGLKPVSAAVLDEPNELNELALEKQRREMRLRFVSEPANIETWRTK